MNFINQLWNFLDGKKTAIGSVCMIAGHIMGKYPQTATAGSILEEVGMYASGAGLGHKAIKALSSEKAE